MPWEVTFSHVSRIRTWASFVGILFYLPQKDLVSRTQTPQGKWLRATLYLTTDPGGQVTVQHGATLMVHFGSRAPRWSAKAAVEPDPSLASPFAQSCYLSLLPTAMDPKGTASISRRLNSVSESASQRTWPASS